MRVSSLACGLLIAALVTGVHAQLESDSLERDYGTDLPHVEATASEETGPTFQLEPGFRLELVAAEPLIADPVAIAFDELGRLFVAQMCDYSEQANERLGVVRQLVDDDGDGRYDRATDYLSQLSWPTAIACCRGGIVVGAAPDLIHARDTNGDGRADESQTLYSGWERHNVQGLLNSFCWGLDNRLYGSSSSNGGQIRAQAPIVAADITLRMRDFALETDTWRLEPITGGGQHGMSFDRWGDRYVSANSDHLQWIEFEDRYLSRNPQQTVPQARRSIAADGPAAEVFRLSPVEPWREIRTRLRVKGLVSGPIEGGGRAAGYFTGATGVTIYTGDAFPAEFQQHTYAFIGDVGGNLVHCKRIDDQGLSKVGRRVHEGREFLASSDVWFRPVQFANGPDGGLYILDMYREVIEHPASLPPLIKKHLDLTRGRDRGRIYRIVPIDFQTPRRPLPGSLVPRDWVAMLGHPNGWHRETAARLLVESADPQSIPWLRDAARQAPSPDARIRALYVLATLNGLDERLVIEALEDRHPRVRQHAIRLAESFSTRSADLVSALGARADDDDLHVRFQLALTLGELPWNDRHAALRDLILRDADDPKMRIALLSSAREGRWSLLRELTDRTGSDLSTGLHAVLADLARQCGKDPTSIDPSQLGDWLRRQLQDVDHFAPLAVAWLKGAEECNEPLTVLLERIAPGTGIRMLEPLISRALEVAADIDSTLERRLQAIEILHYASASAPEDLAARLDQLLTAAQPDTVQVAAVRLAGQVEIPHGVQLLLERAAILSPAARREALDLLCARPGWSERLLQAIVDQQLRAQDLSATHRQQLLQHPDEACRRRATELFQQLPSRQRVVEQYSSVLQKSGDAAAGEPHFRRLCADCHRRASLGHEVGPDLLRLQNRGALYFLTHLLDPNREVDPRYESYLVVTAEGQIVQGIVTAETPNAVVLRKAGGIDQAVQRSHIEEMRSSGISLMPEGMEAELSPTAMADLLAFLLAPDASL